MLPFALLLGCEAPATGLGEPRAADTADTAAAPRVSERLALGEPRGCDAPRDAVTYTESGAAWGLVGPDDPAGPDRSSGGGLVADDLDHDGDLDLVFTHDEDEVRVLRQEAGGFVEDRLPGTLLGLPTLADLDGDGWNDLVVGGKSATTVYRNVEGQLTPTTHLTTTLGPMRGAVPADLDGDDDLDLLVLRRGQDPGASQDTIAWNDGAFALREDLAALEVGAASRMAFDGMVFDHDGDGALDLYVVNDMGPDFGPNVLWRNTGGGFVDLGEACTCGLTMSGMGGSVGDYDGDGDPDLYLTGVWDNVLLSALDDGTYVDTTRVTGADPVTEPDMAWGSAWLDHDNDGQLDVLVAEGDFGPGHAEGEPVQQLLKLLRQDDGVFSDIAPGLGLALPRLWRGVLPLDVNGDGVLDLLAHALDDRPHLFLSDGCTAAGWLSVDAPIGAVVRVTTGQHTQTAWVTSDPGYGAAAAPSAWFGLGDAEVVDRLEVVLPWGGGTLVAEGPFPARRSVRVMPPA